MKVHVEPDFLTQTVKVWIFESVGEGGARQAKWLGGERGDHWQTVEVPAGTRPEPSMHLPEDWLRALVAEASGLVPPDRATELHLQDAIKTRDRIMDAFLPGGES